MSQHQIEKTYGGNPAENYQQYFVPAIGGPVAEDLIKTAALRPIERVLDVACGTGVVARLASAVVTGKGVVAGLDVNPAMLAVARATTSPGMTIEWHEASAERMPFPDASFDAVFCQMGLQFIPDKQAALREMWRVLAPDGRLLINLPGPTPPAFAVMAEELASHIGPQAAGIINQVFSLHDTAQITSLLSGADFVDLSVESHLKELFLPPPEDFLWQYVYSTPLAAAVSGADGERLASLERDVAAGLQEHVQDGALLVRVRIVTATARKK